MLYWITSLRAALELLALAIGILWCLCSQAQIAPFTRKTNLKHESRPYIVRKHGESNLISKDQSNFEEKKREEIWYLSIPTPSKRCQLNLKGWIIDTPATEPFGHRSRYKFLLLKIIQLPVVKKATKNLRASGLGPETWEKGICPQCFIRKSQGGFFLNPPIKIPKSSHLEYYQLKNKIISTLVWVFWNII